MQVERASPEDGAGAVAPPSGPSVEVLATTLRIRELLVERPAIVDYLRTIAPGKQEIALIHALEVGITEMTARRERFGQ